VNAMAQEFQFLLSMTALRAAEYADVVAVQKEQIAALQARVAELEKAQAD
jgi:cell division protein FtsB